MTHLRGLAETRLTGLRSIAADWEVFLRSMRWRLGQVSLPQSEEDAVQTHFLLDECHRQLRSMTASITDDLDALSHLVAGEEQP